MIVKDWEKEQYFEIPYTNENGQITLGEPVETEHDELYITKQQINARLAAARAEDKAVGKMWGPGKHKVWINKEPKTLLVKEESILPTFELIKAKIAAGERIPLGVDHIDEDILKANPLLAEMVEENIGDLMDVGEIKEVATDGQDIYITDSELNNPLIQNLYAKGKLPAFSLEGPFKASECELADVDYVLDFFHDITKTDFVKRGGCLDCLVGKEPNELILSSKLSMEVDKLTDGTNNGTGTGQEPGNDGTGTAGNSGNNPGQNPGEGSTDEPKFITEEQLDQKLDDKFGKLEELINKQPGETQVQAKLAEIEKDNKELKLEAKKAKVAPIVDTAINEGRILKVDREMFMEAGLSAEDLDKWKKSVTDRPVLVDLSEKGKILEAKGQGTFTDGEGNVINLEESSKQIDTALGKTVEEAK